MSYAITFAITLKEPALFTALDGDPNSAVSQDYIPGSALRGFAVGLYMKQQALSELDAADPWCRELFFNGAVSWLNAYPAGKANSRTLPAPRNWVQLKYGEPKQTFVLPDALPEQEKKPKTFKGFIDAANGRYLSVKPERSLKVHVQRSRKFGRAMLDDGAVYRYDGLQSGQTFIAAVMCDKRELAETIRKLLANAGTAVIGGARSAGYGRCEINNVSDLLPDWTEAPAVSSSKKPADQSADYVITLLSDVVLRDSEGMLCADLQTLVSALGLSEKDIKYSYIDTHVVGGFNRKWGLPLQQMPAIAAGSVLITTNAPSAAVMSNGIGERRAEGFGRITASWVPDSNELTLDAIATEDVAKQTVLTDPPEAAKDVVRRLMQQQLEYASLADAQVVEFSGPWLKRSQISRLRAEVRFQLSQESPETNFESFFTELRDTARKQFERQRIKGKNVAAWIHGLGLGSKQSEVSGKFSTVWTEVDTRRAKLLLIDAVLAKLYKESKKDTQGAGTNE